MLVKVGMQGGQFQHLGAVALKDLLPMENIVNKLAPEDLRVRQTEQKCRDESISRGLRTAAVHSLQLMALEE